MKLRVLSTAYEDITDIFLYYESQSRGLGDVFLETLDAIYENILVFPRMYPIKFDGIHRALVPKFPYAVYYSYEQDEAVVLVVRNTKQDPAKLSRIH